MRGISIFPRCLCLQSTTYRQGETASCIDKIDTPPTQGKYFYNVIRNTTGAFYMNITVGMLDSYSVIVEQNVDSTFATSSPLLTPTTPPTSPSNPADQGISIEITLAVVAAIIAVSIAGLAIWRRGQKKQKLG